MSDHINFQVSASPIEEISDENSGIHKIIASEIGTTLGGGGDSVDLTDYSLVAAQQGYKDATVNYLDCSSSAGGTALSAADSPNFVFIKNTGYRYSDATTLGAATTDCVLIVIKEQAWSTGALGGYATSGDTGQEHFYEVAWLKPGQAVVLPLGAYDNSITQFGSNANDLQRLKEPGNNEGSSDIYVRTFTSSGAEASSHNAVEFLFVK